jgi:hypothetical protein
MVLFPSREKDILFSRVTQLAMGAYSAYYSMGTIMLSPGVKQLGL